MSLILVEFEVLLEIHNGYTNVGIAFSQGNTRRWTYVYIDILLNDRKKELDLNHQEFTKFCDSFKLFPDELNNIYAGEAFDDSLLAPISRILGITKE
ncbi:MAG: hypothetical protein ACYTXY_50605, partial [Nostoc sp.]